MGLVDADGTVDHYGGLLRVVDADGGWLADRIDPRTYQDYLGEAVEPWSYLKSTYWKALGYPDGVYRVGPLARLIVADQLGTPRADAELGRSASASGASPAARSTTTTPGSSTRSTRPSGSSSCCAARTSCRRACAPCAGINGNEGIGVAEAPRGTLLHHYRVDDDGLVQWANLVIATGHNNLAMNQGVTQVARRLRQERPAHRGRCSTASRRSSAATTRACRARPTPSARWPCTCSCSGPTARVLDELRR